MVGLLSNTNIIKMFKVFGKNEGAYSFTKSSLLGGNLLLDHAANNAITFSNIVNWGVNDNGCITTSTGYVDTTQIKPGNLADNAEISPTISACKRTMNAVNPVLGEGNSHS